MLSPQSQAGYYWARKKNRLSTALVDDLAAPAWGTLIFAGNPSNGHTVTINGTVLTFVSGTPTGAQIQIAATLDLTLAAVIVYTDANPISGVDVSFTGNGLLVESTTPGDASPTLAASTATRSAATLVRRQANKRVAL